MRQLRSDSALTKVQEHAKTFSNDRIVGRYLGELRFSNKKKSRGLFVVLNVAMLLQLGAG